MWTNAKCEMCLLATDIGDAGEKDDTRHNLNNVDNVGNVDIDQCVMMVIPPDTVSIGGGKNA